MARITEKRELEKGIILDEGGETELVDPVPGRLDNKVVLVTGAGSLLGAEIAIRLAEEGASVALSDPSEKKLQRAIARVGATLDVGAEVTFLVGDVGREEDAVALHRKVKAEFGDVDILVNAAGAVAGPVTSDDENVEGFDPSVLDDPMAKLEASFSRLLQPTVQMVRRLAPGMMKKGWGRILNLALVDVTGQSGPSNFMTIHADVVSLTKSLAAELSPKVLVNCIVAGWSGEEDKKAKKTKIAALPREVADAALSFCSDECGMTGTCFRIGGIQAKL